jgi:large subunit ribosomal protein L10
VLSGKALDSAGVHELATLPSLDELRAKTLGLFNAPAEKFLSTLLAAPRDFLGVLNAKVEKDETATN